jgi:hypothetical protein
MPGPQASPVGGVHRNCFSEYPEPFVMFFFNAVHLLSAARG